MNQYNIHHCGLTDELDYRYIYQDNYGLFEIWFYYSIDLLNNLPDNNTVALWKITPKKTTP
jgi:hypothetical protein